jgi:aldose 1-epimerase
MSRITKKEFGTLSSGEKVYLYILMNSNGMSAEIINYGASVVSLRVPDVNGKIADVILGYDNLEGYINGNAFMGGIVGRYGNRINKGQFVLDGKKYQVTVNNGNNHLHGGVKGFHKVFWSGEKIESDTPAVMLTYVSRDGEEGYPGTVTITVQYNLTKENALEINYKAVTDKPTIINPTSHCYFNLTGSPHNTILNHLVMINAEQFTPINDESITTGELKNVEDTPMDFRKPTEIGSHIDENDIQLKNGKGYDLNWVLNKNYGQIGLAASVYDPESGRFMEVFTDQPGIQFYSGNNLNGTIKGKAGIYYKYRTALCLECQHFPDSPNKKNFPSVILRSGEIYRQTTIYKFSVK